MNAENIKNWAISSQAPNIKIGLTACRQRDIIIFMVKVQRLSRKGVAFREGEMGDTYARY